MIKPRASTGRMSAKVFESARDYRARPGRPRLLLGRKVDIAIHFSDERLCVVTVTRPGETEPIYQIVGRRADLPGSLAEAMIEVRRMYAAEPWPGRQ
jgi:hypothetical protein